MQHQIQGTLMGVDEFSRRAAVSGIDPLLLNAAETVKRARAAQEAEEKLPAPKTVIEPFQQSLAFGLTDRLI